MDTIESDEVKMKAVCDEQSDRHEDWTKDNREEEAFVGDRGLGRRWHETTRSCVPL